LVFPTNVYHTMHGSGNVNKYERDRMCACVRACLCVFMCEAHV